MKELLRKAVEINSIYPSEHEISNYWEDILIKNGFSVERQAIDHTGRANLLAQKGKSPHCILFYGHMDTVPVVNLDDWETNPFELTEKDGKLYGLGASDMKAGIAAFLEATRDTEAYVKIFLAVDEENISEGAWKAVKEKRDFFDDVNLIISAESSFGLGLNGVTRGRTGRCVYEVKFKGDPNHITKYKESEDAIKKMGEFVNRLYNQREEVFNSEETVIQVRKVEGKSIGMSVCGKAELEVETLLGANDSVEGVKKILEKFGDAQIRLKPRKTPYLEGYYFKSFPYQDEISGIIKKHTGKEMSLHVRSSVGDDNVLATLGIPVITWGPVGNNEHSPNEYVSFESLQKISQMFVELTRIVNK